MARNTRKKNLYALVCCFKRYYEANGVHTVNPLDTDDPRFGDFRHSLDAEIQRLHGKGLGTRKCVLSCLIVKHVINFGESDWLKVM